MNTLILNAQVVNEGEIKQLDLYLKSGRIEQIGADLAHLNAENTVDAKGRYVLPGMIDDQVHFREPGLTDKGSIATESAAAVAGGITSYMEMPNVSPPTTNQGALTDKLNLAAQKSCANYAFYLGATENNLEDIKTIDRNKTAGVKIFMGSSTGNLLVENPKALDAIFANCPILIATHCEDNRIIAQNQAAVDLIYQNNPPISAHPRIRSEDACYASSSLAVSLAKRHGSQLHVLHLTTARELELFEPGPIAGKSITAEACVHHLWFCDQDYEQQGNFIKCNPAIKTEGDRAALLKALAEDRIDIIATDHAPHTFAEKSQAFRDAPAGLPLVQHALLTLFDHVKAGRMTLPQVVQKTAHNPTIRYQVKERGFIREGYHADLVMVDPEAATLVTEASLLYHCAWSAFMDHEFSAKICSTWVNGLCVFDGDNVNFQKGNAEALYFDRDKS